MVGGPGLEGTGGVGSGGEVGSTGASAGAGVGSTGVAGAGTTPRVYHDAVLASQQSGSAGAEPRDGSGALPPLVPPPIDPSLGGYKQQPAVTGAPATSGGGSWSGNQSGSWATDAGAAAVGAAGSEGREPTAEAAAQEPQFPMARVFDGTKPDGSPLISRQALDPREIPGLVTYLTRAPVALSAPGTSRDEMVVGAPASVPRIFHTDGVWVWPAAVGYYLSRYQLPPQPELLAHIRARRYAPAPVHPEAIKAAGAQVLAVMNGQREQKAPGPAVAVEVTRLAEFSAAFNAAGNRHAAWVTEQLETFLAFLPLGDWSVDHRSRTYRQSGREFVVDGLGTLSASGDWTWAWADPATWGQDSAITGQARRLRTLGEHGEIPELATPALGLDGIADAPDGAQDAAEMIAWTAMGLLGARGYIGHSAADESGGRTYYVVCDAAVPEAAPELATVPRFLMEGTATFGEDAVDCVLGYVEHYGWDWSRVPDGIVVAAEGMGSFTIEISPDGQLTGLSLHS